MSSYRRLRERTDPPPPDDSDLMCVAHGCPNRWSVRKDGEQALCSAHAWSEPHLWPRITQEQLDAQTDRARNNAFAASKSVEALKHDRHLPERAELMARAQQVAQGLRATLADPLAWARRLRNCELHEDGFLPNGRLMTQFQREAWRFALRKHEPKEAEQ